MKKYIFVAGFSILLLAVASIIYTITAQKELIHTVNANDKQQTIITSLPPPTNIVTQKTLKVFDANGTELGIYANSSDLEVQRIFIPSVNRFLDLLLDTGSTDKSVDLVFTTNNCSGIPYLVTTLPGGTSAAAALNAAKTNWQVLAENNNTYYSIDTSTKVIITRLRSSQKPGEECKKEELGDLNVIPGVEITLPFPLPVKLPLEVRYE